MKQFSISDWSSFKAGDVVKTTGITRYSIRLAKPAALQAALDPSVGFVLVGFGSEFAFQSEPELYFKANADGVIQERAITVLPATGVPLTNMDKQPLVSPAMVEVTRARVALQQQVRREMERIRVAGAELAAARAAAGLPAPAVPQSPVEPEPVDPAAPTQSQPAAPAQPATI